MHEDAGTRQHICNGEQPTSITHVTNKIYAEVITTTLDLFRLALALPLVSSLSLHHLAYMRLAFQNAKALVVSSPEPYPTS